MRKISRALTIAGSDSSGGAGIQADLRVFEALGVYGTSAITAVTAQNTLRILGVRNVSHALIEAQINAVLCDVGADAVKTGMLRSTGTVRTVAACLGQWKVKHLVVDPVIKASTGVQLMTPRARRSLSESLFPLAELITPNIPEAGVLVGQKLRSRSDLESAGRSLLSMGPRGVLIKGGHTEDLRVVTDLLFLGTRVIEISSPRVRTGPVHGTGCVLSAAITANLARGHDLVSSCRRAKTFVDAVIRRSLPLGKGQRLLAPRTGG
jgi:hydroxymethylpyrimidine/phosphomethylpyrimidine kinase